MKSRTLVVLIVLCLAALSMAAQERSVASPDSGQQVAVDANGQLRPPTAEEQALLATAPVANHPLKIRTLANGAVGIALDESFDFMLVATTDADGGFLLSCTDDHDTAASMLKAAPADTILRLRPRAETRPAAERE